MHNFFSPDSINEFISPKDTEKVDKIKQLINEQLYSKKKVEDALVLDPSQITVIVPNDRLTNFQKHLLISDIITFGWKRVEIKSHEMGVKLIITLALF